ncbi:MAG: hypothetical protein NC834_03700 [Candidatus Omnitrophica bacterium]|nr:hypothetical protein [Candidatus Omnitrophota bacterium]
MIGFINVAIVLAGEVTPFASGVITSLDPIHPIGYVDVDGKRYTVYTPPTPSLLSVLQPDFSTTQPEGDSGTKGLLDALISVTPGEPFNYTADVTITNPSNPLEKWVIKIRPEDKFKYLPNFSLYPSALGKIEFESNLGNNLPTYDLNGGNLGGFLGGFGW